VANIVGVKDAAGNPGATAAVKANTPDGFEIYSGDDAMTLPLLAVGAVGVVGTSTHFSGVQMKQLIEAYLAGDPATALTWHRRLLPIFTGVFATQGCILVKAGLRLQGRGNGRLRPPMPSATQAETEALAASLAAAGLAATPD
jgi:4-hydroxy-tetrahydrodipicolinate synthase